MASVYILEPCNFGVNCNYPCHCQNNQVCNIDNGSCPTGCDDGDLGGPGDFWYTGAWYGYGCQIGNVAYGKHATQGVDTYNNHVAARALDGNHDWDLNHNHCVHTIDNSSPRDPSWWEVDLGETYVVLAVNITNRFDCGGRCSQRTANLDITVGEDGATYDLCKQVGSEGGNAATFAKCQRPLRGRYVRLKRHTGVYEDYIINLCEIQVYGYLYYDCPNAYFGVACLISCNCKEPCDDLSGECFGQMCVEGWQGTDCQTACSFGNWGSNCVKRCNCMDVTEECDRFIGRCMSGCASGYGGIGCDLVLPELSGTVEFSHASSNTIRISFSAWSRENNDEEIPIGYTVQHRKNGTTIWRNVSNVDHNANVARYSVTLKGLEPGTVYYIRVAPFIKDAGGSYWGTPTEDVSFETLSVSTDGQAQSDHSTTIAGVVCFIIIGILVGVIVVLVWRRFNRQKPDNQELEVPVIEEISGDFTENGHENPVNARPAVLTSINSGKAGNQIAHSQTPSEKRSIGGTRDALHINNGSAQYENVVIEAPSSVPMGDDEHIYGNQDLVGRPLRVDELALYIEEMSGRKDAFKDEFSEIPSGMTASAEVGKKAINRNLNKFNNICAYDHSRVVLKAPADGSRTDYINANYIPNYDGDSKGYIAAQGPKRSTVIDMWAMVWQTGANRIVMLTNLCESGKTKCEQYWPDSGVADYGHFKVTLVDTERFADYTLRVLSLVHTDGVSRPVYQFHFTAWPDSEVPELATSLLDFRRKVRSHDHDAKGPLVVHCSAGIGRTGTFLALDYLLDQLETEGMVDVLSYTTLMRTNRVDMIQTLAQYVFVYKTLLEAVQTGETIIPSNEMEARYIELKQSQKNGRSTTEEQFALLRCLEQQQTLSKNDGALCKENLAKNRDKNIVPLDKHRPFLTSTVDGTNNYINAFFVGGYRERRAYIATQHPLPNTVVDLWRLLYEHKCSSIITLEQPGPGGEDTPVFWPTEKDCPLVLKQLSVTMQKEEDLDDGIIKMIEFEITVNNKNPLTVRMYQFLHWVAEPELPSPENTLKLLDHAERWQLRSGHGALCFQCKYGYERCGLMIAACYMLEKLKVDREVDVFQAVKQVRIPRPQLVTSVAQYEFLHELAIAYINSCEDYANFK